LQIKHRYWAQVFAASEPASITVFYMRTSEYRKQIYDFLFANNIHGLYDQLMKLVRQYKDDCISKELTALENKLEKAILKGEVAISNNDPHTVSYQNQLIAFRAVLSWIKSK